MFHFGASRPRADPRRLRLDPEESSTDLSDRDEKKKFIVNYFFNMKDKSGLVNAKTLKAENRLVQRMVAFISLMCFMFGEIAMTIEFQNSFKTEMIQDILLIFVIVMKIILIVCLVISSYISR